jgi:hypothetical protein
MDTHALSVPALASALEVLAANGVDVMIAQGDEYTPTPAVSHAILRYNHGRKTGLELAGEQIQTVLTHAPSICAASWRKRKQSSAILWRRRRGSRGFHSGQV